MASFTIPEAYVTQFGSNVRQLALQRRSRLRRTIMDVETIVGEAKRCDFSLPADTNPNLVTERYGRMPLNLVNYTFRWMYPKVYDYATLVETFDKAKLLLDPKSTMTREHSGFFGRQMDDDIIEALGGIVQTGETGGTPSPLPNSQKVVSGSVGLTIAKLILAREILVGADIDEDQQMYLIHNPRQISDLLEDPKITSAEYNVVKALYDGKIRHYMGFEFINSNRLAVDSSDDRLLYAYTSSALKWGDHIGISTRADPRPDLRGVPEQAYSSGGWDVIRAEDVQVVQIACTEN